MPLKYTGNGRHIMGIPARDLADDELESIANRDGVDPVALADELTAGGLYELVEAPKPRKTKTVESEDTD